MKANKMMNGKCAILSSESKYTIFKFGRHTIRFKAPHSMEHYSSVKEWDHGYLVVMAKYSHNSQDEADLIVNGYAFKRREEGVRVLNLHRPDRAVVFSQNGEVLETSMDNIELCIASDRKLTEAGSAKFFVKENGDSVLQKRGVLNNREIRTIQDFIKQHYKNMYTKWLEYSEEGFYKNK